MDEASWTTQTAIPQPEKGSYNGRAISPKTAHTGNKKTVWQTARKTPWVLMNVFERSGCGKEDLGGRKAENCTGCRKKLVKVKNFREKREGDLRQGGPCQAESSKTKKKGEAQKASNKKKKNDPPRLRQPQATGPKADWDSKPKRSTRGEGKKLSGKGGYHGGKGKRGGDRRWDPGSRQIACQKRPRETRVWLATNKKDMALPQAPDWKNKIDQATQEGGSLEKEVSCPEAEKGRKTKRGVQSDGDGEKRRHETKKIPRRGGPGGTNRSTLIV